MSSPRKNRFGSLEELDKYFIFAVDEKKIKLRYKVIGLLWSDQVSVYFLDLFTVRIEKKKKIGSFWSEKAAAYAFNIRVNSVGKKIQLS